MCSRAMGFLWRIVVVPTQTEECTGFDAGSHPGSAPCRGPLAAGWRMQTFVGKICSEPYSTITLASPLLRVSLLYDCRLCAGRCTHPNTLPFSSFSFKGWGGIHSGSTMTGLWKMFENMLITHFIQPDIQWAPCSKSLIIKWIRGSVPLLQW